MATTLTAGLADATPDQAALFWDPTRWADMGAWHRDASAIQNQTRLLRCEPKGYLPFYAVTHHRDVFAVSRDSATWLNTDNVVLGLEADRLEMLNSGFPPPSSLVQLDAQEHHDHRGIASPWFKPRAVATRQERIDEIADEYIDKMRELGESCDFAADIAQPYTLRVIMDIYGVPESDEPLMLELTQGIFGAADPEFLGTATDPKARVFESIMRFVQYFNDITADRQACPKDDLASIIANGEIDGCPMADDRRLWYYIIVATAGHDTTSFALSGGLEQLARDPEQLWSIAGDEARIDAATNEIIRWTSPVRHFMRYASADTELAGVKIAAGERVLISYPAANRDDEVFNNSQSFDVARTDSDRLISFGVGTHYCLGSQFARRELRTMLRRLSTRLSHLELAGEPQFSESYFVSGVKHLPINYRFR